MARSQEQNDRLRARHRREWLDGIRSAFDGTFTAGQATEVWCCDISNTRIRLKELKRSGLVAVVEAVFWPKPKPWCWVITPKGRAL